MKQVRSVAVVLRMTSWRVVAVLGASIGLAALGYWLSIVS